jgi:pimeloyl-ACP methyl ester carboxylesterase
MTSLANSWPLEGSFDFRGDTIRYRSQGSGPDLLLVHGTPFSSYVWHRIVPAIEGAWRVHVFDLLGYGQSTMRDAQDVSLGIQNRVLAAFIAHLGLHQPTVVAHDFGGATSLRAHLLDGVAFKRLLLIDPVAIRPWGSPFVRHVAQHEAAFQGIPGYIHEAMVARYVRGAVFRTMTDEELQPYVEPWLGPVGQPAFYRQIAQMDERYTDEIEAAPPGIGCPVNILWGEADEWIPVGQGRKLQSMIPGAVLETVPRSGHLMQEDAPEAILAAIHKLTPA